MSPPIEIVVDELVVRGLPPGDARTAADAFETHLARLAVGDSSVAERTESFRALPAIESRRGDLGEAVAGAVWSEISDGSTR